MAQLTKQYDAIILAGYAQKPTDLSIETGALCKALVPVAGRPMISYVIDALQASGRMRRLVLAGITLGDIPGVHLDIPVLSVPNHYDTISNSLAAIEALDAEEPVLFCSTDIPMLTAAALLDFLARCEACGADLCYPIVTRETMEARFPGSGRSFRNLADGSFAGGDLYLVRPQLMRANAAFARSLTANRKSAWGLVQVLGAEIIFRFLVHRLRVSDLEKRVNKILRCSCKAIVSGYPELAMDVDKPQHLEVVLRAMHQGQA